VISICGVVPSGHSGATSIANGVIWGREVEVEEVVVVEDGVEVVVDVLVGTTVEVVVLGAVVELVVVLDDVVVVPPPGRH
jgi:hypothetical protein